MRSLAFVLVLLVLVGCGPKPIETDYHSGREGVVATFGTNTPPDRVSEGDGFLVQVDLHNKGAASISPAHPGLLRLSYDPTIIGEGEGFPAVTNISLAGKSIEYPRGERAFVDVGYLYVKQVAGSWADPSTSVSLGICYPYQTLLSTTVCVDSDPNDQNYRVESCESGELLSFSDQGAPVAITAIEPRYVLVPASGGVGYALRAEYEVTVRNLGSGTVFAPVSPEGMGALCSFADVRGKVNRIAIEARLGQHELECLPEVVELINDEGSVSCRLPADGLLRPKSNYEAALSVALNYTYIETLSKQIEARRVGGGGGAVPIETDGCGAGRVKLGDDCVSLCEFCAANADDERCSYFREFTRYGSGWSCTCSASECRRLFGQDGAAHAQCLPMASVCASGYCCDPSGLS